MPVDRRVEGFCELIVATAQQRTAVPGRTTDVQDADGMADALQHGLLSASGVPSQQQHNLRDVTRWRISLVQEQTRLVHRIHTVLEAAGCQLSAMLSALPGL